MIIKISMRFFWAKKGLKLYKQRIFSLSRIWFHNSKVKQTSMRAFKIAKKRFKKIIK